MTTYAYLFMYLAFCIGFLVGSWITHIRARRTIDKTFDILEHEIKQPNKLSKGEKVV